MDEIGIKEVVEVIKKKKWVLISFTAVCVLASLFFSYFFEKPSYNAKLTFNVDPLEMESGIIPGAIVYYNGTDKTPGVLNGLDNKLLGPILKQFKYPSYDINTMTNIINSQEFRDKVYGGLKLDRSISFQAICNNDAKLITIIATGTKQEGLVNAAKSIFEYFSKHMRLEIEAQIEKNNELLKKGLNKEKTNINNYKKGLSQFPAEVGAVGAEGILDNMPEDQQAQYREIMDNYSLSNQAFDAYKLIEKEFELLKQSDIDTLLNVRILSQDSAPLKTSPRIAINAVLAAAAGFMFCFIAVFFIEFISKKLR